MATDDGDRFDLTGKIVIRGRAPEFIGSYSVVYRGQWAENTVAVKIIRPVGALSTMRRKVRRERVIWESLEHPNILPFYGHADDEDFQPFGAFISPWCLNGDVGRFLEQHGGEMETPARVLLWIGVLNGVAFLHSRKPIIVHGDLKPGNILIDDNRNPRICDFGLSRIIQEGGTGGMTTTTEHAGTERYLASELVTDNLPTPTTQSDIYALGCLGLEFIYLERPYAHRQNNHHGCIITDIREGIPPANRQDDVHSPMDVWWGILRSWNLLESLWSPDPGGRPAAIFVILVTSTNGPDNAHMTRGVPMRHHDTPVESRDGSRLYGDERVSSKQYTTSSRQLRATPVAIFDTDARRFLSSRAGEKRDHPSIEGTSSPQSTHLSRRDNPIISDVPGLGLTNTGVATPTVATETAAGVALGREVHSPVELGQPESVSDSSTKDRRAGVSLAESPQSYAPFVAPIPMLLELPPESFAQRAHAFRTIAVTSDWPPPARPKDLLASFPPIVRRPPSFEFPVRGDLEGEQTDQRTVEIGRQTPEDGEARRVPKSNLRSFTFTPIDEREPSMDPELEAVVHRSKTLSRRRVQS